MCKCTGNLVELFGFGNDAAKLEDYAWFNTGYSEGTTHPVGQKKANAWGIHEMHGNVWQWCLDPQDQPYRVLKGAAWNSWIEVNLRPEFRWYSRGPGDRHETFGFRVVLAPATRP